MKKIEVVAAIVVYQNQILCVQRGEAKLDYISKKWEFPGGKIESNESKSEALSREIKEELDLEILNLQFFTTVQHEYPDFHLTMHAYLCISTITEPRLTEHLDYKWLTLEQLPSLDWAAADIPIVKELMKNHDSVFRMYYNAI